MRFSEQRKQKKSPYKKGGKHRCKTGWTLGDSAKTLVGLGAIAVGVQVVKEVL